jgi:hypothetical protein
MTRKLLIAFVLAALGVGAAATASAASVTWG